MGTRELKVLYNTILQEDRLREEEEEATLVQLRNFRIRESRAMGVTRSSQMHPRDLAVWRARFQSRMNELSRRWTRIKASQATLTLRLCEMDQILVTAAHNIEALVFLKKNSGWNGSARVPYLPQARREQLVPELTRNGIPIIYSFPRIIRND